MTQSSIRSAAIVGVSGPALLPAEAALLRAHAPAGVILFARNVVEPVQLQALTAALRQVLPQGAVLMLDQEGGRVSRLREIGSEPPNAQQLRDKGDAALIARHGHITGRLLRLFGFNLDLCPVLDISFDDDADNSLRGRCYGKSVEQVIALAGAFNEGLRGEGIASCGKHFPGYSRAPIDAHHELPQIDLTRADLDAHELAVFRHFADKLDSMMIGHAYYPSLDASGTPTSLSRPVVVGLLRQEMGFGGLIMTDDLDMGAILNHYGLEETIRLAITAGNDLAMICHRIPNVEDAWKTLDRLPSAELERALENVHRFKTTMAPPDAFSEEEFQRRDAEVWQLRVDTLGEEKARERSPENGKRSPVETY